MPDNKYVLDTSAILSGFALNYRDTLISAGVYEEIKKGRAKRNLDLNIDNFEIVEPGPEYLKMVADAAKITNDLHNLSETDMEVIAVAIEYDATIITDDYAIQNVAKFMNVRFQNFGMDKIKSLVIWKYKCTGCSRYFNRYYRECPVCGSPVKRVRR